MTFGEASARKMAALLLRHAAWVSPPDRKEWSHAMTNELEHVPRGVAALRWALGCALVGYLERMNTMTRSLTNLPRWLLSLEMAVCLVPLTWLFIAILAMTVRGRMPVDFAALAGSATLLGPVCLAVAMRIVFVKKASVGRETATLLPLLAAWTVVAYSGQLLHGGTPLSAWWREWVLIAPLPCWAVVHLLQINSERRTMAAVA
jgi:uncharacterized membrane protein YhdT